MRPVSVRFKCFGPYVQEQFVDFSELDRIFAISGETGSGKTTILDAMCYALYGSSSSGDRGEFSAMRCQLSKDDEDTFVEFIFEENGKKYRFGRCYAKARSKFNETYICDEETEDGWKPVAANIKKSTMLQQAEAILHLNADQFRQIIILPQGKFESFLVSDSKVKESVLESIFDASRWGEIAVTVMNAVSKKDEALKEKERRHKELLTQYGCESTEEAEAKKESEEEKLNQMTDDLKAKTEESAALQEELETALQDEKDFKELDSRKHDLNKLMEQKEYWLQEEKRLDRVRSAQEIASTYDAYTSASEIAANAMKERAGMEKKAQQADKLFASAELKKQEHANGAEEQSRRISRRTLLENAADTYKDIGDLRTKFLSAESGKKNAEYEAALAKKAMIGAEQSRKTAVDAAGDAADKYASAFDSYRRGIAGVLAAELEDNKPCRVCGSRHHPDPAVCNEPPVSEMELDELKNKLDNSYAVRKKAVEAFDKAKDDFDIKDSEARKADAALTAAEAELRAAEKNLIEGISDETARLQKIGNLTKQIDSYQKKTEELDKLYTDTAAAKQSADDAFSKAKAESTAAEEQLESVRKVWQQALAESVFENEEEFLKCRLTPKERDELTEKLTTYRTQLESAADSVSQQEKICEGKTRPDIAFVKDKKKAVDDDKIRLDKDCDSLRNCIDKLKGDMEEYLALRPVLFKERNQLDNDILFAERLRGNKGVSIKRYVLGIMMTMIISQANGFLKNIYGGRYRLHKAAAEEKNRKVGLELEIEDLQSGDFRGVSSLSGGEKFLVALSLAIGLSSVVQLQGKGVHMDAMFVDEGFGSLHPSAVDDAISILAQARGSDGIVGVITHVDQVVKSIGTGLEAVKGPNGSTLRPLSGL